MALTAEWISAPPTGYVGRHWLPSWAEPIFGSFLLTLTLLCFFIVLWHYWSPTDFHWHLRLLAFHSSGQFNTRYFHWIFCYFYIDTFTLTFIWFIYEILHLCCPIFLMGSSIPTFTDIYPVKNFVLLHWHLFIHSASYLFIPLMFALIW